MLKTAFLPKITVDCAQQLTQLEDVDTKLDLLTKRNYFTVKREHPAPAYEYHPLFREFLLSRANEVYTKGQLQTIQAQAAYLLYSQGHYDDAALLYINKKDWPSLSMLIIEHAQAFIEKGQSQTVSNWVKNLPTEMIVDNPWLLFWRAASQQATNLFESREDYKKAYLIFKTQGDPIGIYLAWASVVDTFFYVWIEFGPLEYWINEFDEIHQCFPEFPSIEIEAKVTHGILGALLWRMPEHKHMTKWCERAEDMLRIDIDPTLRVMIGNHLSFYYFWWRGNLSKGNPIISMVAPNVSTTSISVLPKLMWKVMDAVNFYFNNKGEAAAKVANEGLKIAKETGVYYLDFLLHAQVVYGHLTNFDSESAKNQNEIMAQYTTDAATFDVAHHYYLGCWIALGMNDLPTALESGEICMKAADKMGTGLYSTFSRLGLGQALLENNEFDRAKAILEDALKWGRDVGNLCIESHYLLSHAYIALLEDKHEKCLAYLRDALLLCKQHGFISLPWIGWRKSILITLYSMALEHHIEVDYVQRLIRERNLIPETPPLHLDNWPWLVKIFTLGQFRLSKDDTPVRSSARVQKKPLEMLKALIAFGGRDVAEEKLNDALWPDADGVTAHQSFNTTLHRLRKIIGNDVLLLQKGRLSLDPRRVWVDVWAFERLLEQLGKATIPIDALPHLTDQAMALYQGPFLGMDTDPSWAMRLQEKLRNRWLRTLSGLVQRYAQAGLCEHVTQLYLKGLEVDELAEEFYRRLMQCYAQQGQRAKALAVYQRCKKHLANQLSITPSDKTEAVHQAVLKNDANTLKSLCTSCRRTEKPATV